LNNLIVWEGGIALFKYIDCIDASSEYCPCSLAENGECLVCSQLKGKEFCDCVNWKGTCIYQEYIWNREKGKTERKYRIYNIKSKNFIRENIMILKININSSLARELNNIGAFVFLKKPGDPDCYSSPISIMECDVYNNIITVAIKLIGIKTKQLDKCEDEIMIKGPYWNGIQGQIFLKDIRDKNCLIIGRGIALAPAVMAAKKTIQNGNRVFALLEKGRSKENYLKQYFEDINCIVENVYLGGGIDKLSNEGKALIDKYLEEKEINTILSAGDDNFHRNLMNYIYSLKSSDKIKFATVNNATMCCGEGVCGSCIVENSRANKIRACKEQYNPMEIFLKGGANE
jgi:dihydroorotate dehydrogenase electron transfer subunit